MKKQVETIASNSSIDPSIAKTLSDAHLFVENKPNVIVSQSPHVKTADNTKPSFIIPKGQKTLLIRKRNLFDVEDGVNLNEGTNVDVDIKKDDKTKKPDRKTRWGPDPKNDPVVRRGLALALQACLNVVTWMYLALIFILYVF